MGNVSHCLGYLTLGAQSMALFGEVYLGVPVLIPAACCQAVPAIMDCNPLES